MMLGDVRAKITTLVALLENNIITSRIFRKIYKKKVEIYNFMFTKLTAIYLLDIQIAATLWLMILHLWRTLTSLCNV